MLQMNLINWDFQLFEAINTGMSSLFLDAILPWMREPLFWFPLYTFIIAFAFFNYGKKAYWLVLFLGLTAGSSDMISSRLVKKSIQRIRPCNDDKVMVIERVRCGSGFSFTSTHATNHFAVASFLIATLGIHHKRIKPWLWFWAALISFSQIYVGVHYPLDILGGAVLGISIGKLWSILYHKYYGGFLARKEISV
jgi:membrane-associated phospholipid phosphatase